MAPLKTVTVRADQLVDFLNGYQDSEVVWVEASGRRSTVKYARTTEDGVTVFFEDGPHFSAFFEGNLRLSLEISA